MESDRNRFSTPAIVYWFRFGGMALIVVVFGSLFAGARQLGRIEATVDALGGRVDRMETSVNDRFERLEDRMEAQFERMDARFERLEDRMDRQSERMDARFEATEQRLLRIESTLLEVLRALRQGEAAPAAEVPDLEEDPGSREPGPPPEKPGPLPSG